MRFFLALWLLCLGLPNGVASAENAVSLRAGAHADKDRIVLDFTAPPRYQLSVDAPHYTITFDKPIKLKLPNIKNLKRVESVQQTGDMQLSLTLAQGQKLQLSKLGNKLVMDAVAGKETPNEKSKPNTEAAPKPAAEKTEPAPAPEKPVEKPAEKKVEKPVEKKSEKPSPVQLAPWSEDQDAISKPAIIPNDLSRQITQQLQNLPSVKPAPAAAPPAQPPAPSPAPTGNAGPGGRPLTLAELAAQKAAKPANEKSGEAKQPAETAPEKPAEPQDFSALPMQLPTPSAVGQIKIKVPPNVKFSAYLRGRKFWIVLDQPTLAMPTDADGTESDQFGPTTRYQVGQGTGTAYRIQLRENQFPAITKSDGDELVFTLYTQAPLIMPVGLPIVTDNQPDSGPKLKISALGFATPIRVSDPDVGDQLIVVPATPDTGAVSDPRRWPQVEFLPALNGVVVSPLIDNLIVDANRQGVMIARPPKGLMLSGIKGLVDKKDRGQGELIYDLKRWRISSFKNFRKTQAQLENIMASTKGVERMNQIMQITRFLFAQGYPQEANGWLRILAQDYPTSLNMPEFILLRGAVRVAMRDVFPGDRDLSLTGYAFEPEIALWRGWAAAQNEDYPRARYFFGLASELLNDYPDPYFKPIALAAAETALLTGDAVAGSALITRVEARKGLQDVDKMQIKYLRGLTAQLNGDFETAKTQWAEAAKGRNRIFAAKSELAMVQLGMQKETMPPEEAIKKLDHLRFQWRGDAIELTALSTLANLFMENKQPRKAFECWQVIIRYFSNDPQAEMARQNISKNLESLFANPEAESQSPIETLALYRDFISYAPDPAIRDQIARKLVDSLAAVGMYQEASDILNTITVPRPDPNAKDNSLSLLANADDILRLSSLELLDGQPTDAIRALGLIDRIHLSAPHELEHRLLSARANFQLKKLDEALKELGDVNDTNANRMRLDIFWKQKKWGDAARILPSLLGEVPADGKLTPEQSKNLLQQAVALSLSANQPALDALREKYGAAMDQTDDAASFRLVTLPPKGSELQSVKSIQSRLGDVDSFSSFLQGYKQKPKPEAKPEPKIVPKTEEPLATKSEGEAAPKADEVKSENPEAKKQ